jgi:glyceraldehyde 3-phosphate dehydrogenase
MARARLAINGFGRIGRLLFRQLHGNPAVEIVAVNDLGDLQNLAYLLQYDTVYRRYGRAITVDEAAHTFSVDGTPVQVLQEKDPTKLPWGALKVDIVVECTGLFESFEGASVHLKAGAKRVVISAPAKDAEGTASGATVLMGVNEQALHSCAISSNGSCTTNAASPVMAIMSENPGIQKAVLDTVHAYTATQNLVDGPVKGGDFRHGRAAAQNMVPHTTGSAISVDRAIPALDGKFDGLAVRVPVVTGSIADITFLAKRKTTVEEINDIFRTAAADPRWQGIMTISEEQLVSSDIIGQPYGAIIDLSFTKVIDGDLVKILSWYDNEYGYVATLVKHIEAVANAV